MSVEGVLPVIPTPFLDGRFDPESFERFLEHMLPWVDGYVVLGSTGEAPSLTSDERREIAALALEMTPRDKTVVVGVSHTTLAETVGLARHAEDHGAAAVLCAAPYYFLNAADGVGRYLAALDDSIGIELVFYDNPAATKTQLSAAEVIGWARDLEHLNAVKLTDHDLSKVAAWQDAGLKVLAGDDPIAFRYMAAGVDGAMLIAPSVLPEPFRTAWDLARAGRVEDAYRTFGREVAPFIHAFGIGDEIATTKALMADIGVFSSAEVRLPLLPSSSERRDVVRWAYEGCVAAAASG
jgi:4-hydroxy-tetrahydrodipicolinate synthase